MKFCYEFLPFLINPKDLDLSQDGSRFLSLFWKEKPCVITEEIPYQRFVHSFTITYVNGLDESIAYICPKWTI